MNPNRSCYTKDELQDILNSIKFKTEINPEAFLIEVEQTAIFYKNWFEAELNHPIKYSDEERRFGRLRQSLAKLSQNQKTCTGGFGDRNLFRRIKRGQDKVETFLRLIKASPDSYQNLRSAAKRIADREGSLPDFSPEQHSVEGFSHSIAIWPIDEQIAKALESGAGLDWLGRVAAEAEERSRLEIELAADGAHNVARLRAGPRVLRERQPRHEIRLAGNRPDEPRHWLVRSLMQVYRKSALRPSGLSYDDEKEQGGEIFHFLHACLHPLGITLPFQGLRALCQRANR